MAAATSGGTRERAQYTGELTKEAVKRVQTEQLDVQRNPMYADGIFLLAGEQLHACKALIIGPPETPYQYGFYLFDVKYPNDYPWSPPQVSIMTGDRRVRLNPNLYVGGKVCLSILGTWSGPPWTPAYTLRTVMLSIQSLLHSHPLQNEPAFAKVTGERDERYSRILSYENIGVAVLRMLEFTPEGFDVFRPHMAYYFLRNVESHKAVLQGLLTREGEEEESPLGAFKTKYEPNNCKSQVEEWAKRLRADRALMQRVGELEAEMRAVVPDLPSAISGPATQATCTLPSACPLAAPATCRSPQPLGEDIATGEKVAPMGDVVGTPVDTHAAVSHPEIICEAEDDGVPAGPSPSSSGLWGRLCGRCLAKGSEGPPGRNAG